MSKRFFCLITLYASIGVHSFCYADNESSGHDVLQGCSQVQLRLLHEMINVQRQEGVYCGRRFYRAAPNLSTNTQLEHAAHRHTQDMAQNNFFSHTGSDKSTTQDRVNATGYVWLRIAENIAIGQHSAAAVLKSWVQSKSHCRNLMSKEYSQLGLACSINPNSKDKDKYQDKHQVGYQAKHETRHQVYWGLVLAKPR